jgi:putative ABC transport system permease protein
MSLWKIALRSIQHRALASVLTAFSMALGVGLVVTVIVIHGVIDKSFKRGAQGYDLIVGPKGSSLELVLNTVYHLGRPLGRIPYEYYLELSEGRFSPEVELAIPVCMGGNYKGFRVVGTTPEMFDELEYRGGEKYRFGEGQNFDWGEFHTGVVGATVARKTGLKVGDTFRPVHGFDAEQGEEHDPFTVVGILEQTGTPNDRALFINIEGFYLIHQHGEDEGSAAGSHGHEDDGHDQSDAHSSGHDHEKDEAGEDAHDHAHEADGHDHEHETHDSGRMVTAVLVCTSRVRTGEAYALPKLINEEPEAQAIFPSEVITRLFEGIVGNVQLVLLVLAVLVVVVAGVGMMVSIYNSMNDRRHDIAVMRALGARRQTVMVVILLESILLSLGGGAVGLVLGHVLTGALAPSIMEHTGVVVNALHFQLSELILIPGLIILASLVGYLPAVVAYRTDVAQSLTNTP